MSNGNKLQKKTCNMQTKEIHSHVICELVGLYKTTKLKKKLKIKTKLEFNDTSR